MANSTLIDDLTLFGFKHGDVPYQNCSMTGAARLLSPIPYCTNQNLEMTEMTETFLAFGYV
jgi:hypothetical protein